MTRFRNFSGAQLSCLTAHFFLKKARSALHSRPEIFGHPGRFGRMPKVLFLSLNKNFPDAFFLRLVEAAYGTVGTRHHRPAQVRTPLFSAVETTPPKRNKRAYVRSILYLKPNA